MWPSLSDMSRDECRKCLRCLELDAYGNMVSVLRAQGPFTEEKKKLLGELAKVLHISNERHRAEIRRAVNDEKLSVIAEQLNGPNTCTAWAIEGRRTVPLLPRLKAHTAFTGLANSLSLVIAAANEKKIPPTSRVEDSTVKAETASREETEVNERPMAKVPILHTELNAKGKKRKRSSPGSSDNDKSRKAQSTETKPRDTEAISISRGELRVASPLPIDRNDGANVVQVSIVTPSSTADTTSRNDNTLESSTTQLLKCSSTNVSKHQKFIIGPSTTRNPEEMNSTASTHISGQNSATCRQDIPKDVVEHPVSAKSRLTAVRTSTKIQQSVAAQFDDPKSSQSEGRESRSDGSVAKDVTTTTTTTTTTTEEGTKISRPDSTTQSTPCPKRLITTKFCVTTKPIITSSTNCVVTVNSGSTASSGPGPPCVTPSATLTYKKMPPGKLNHHSGTKMGITLNSSKTLKLNAHPNARLATKANVIVVQKGPSRGVTLSHGGKEVLGKVIMGGKNLCLASQKSNTSLALIPHRGGASSNNGEQTLNANHVESLKLGGKAGNMIMLDIRQEVPKKNMAQFLESSGSLNYDSNSKNPRSPMTNNHVYDSSKSDVLRNSKSLALVNNSVESREIFETTSEDCSSLYSSTGIADSSDLTDNREILVEINEEKLEFRGGVLDAQTGMYNYESADGIIIDGQVDESSIETSGIDIFSTALDTPDANLEDLRYLNDEDHEIVIEPSDQVIHSPFGSSTAEQLDELSGDS